MKKKLVLAGSLACILVIGFFIWPDKQNKISNLPTNLPIGARIYCSDAATRWGKGSMVEWNGKHWITLPERLPARATYPSHYVRYPVVFKISESDIGKVSDAVVAECPHDTNQHLVGFYWSTNSEIRGFIDGRGAGVRVMKITNTADMLTIRYVTDDER